MILGLRACFACVRACVWLLPTVVVAEPHTTYTDTEVPMSYPHHHQLFQNFVSLDAEFFIFGSLMHVMVCKLPTELNMMC